LVSADAGRFLDFLDRELPPGGWGTICLSSHLPAIAQTAQAKSKTNANVFITPHGLFSHDAA
jgi:hypothetical protein